MFKFRDVARNSEALGVDQKNDVDQKVSPERLKKVGDAEGTNRGGGMKISRVEDIMSNYMMPPTSVGPSGSQIEYINSLG